jgi:hypothetical protein
VSSGEAMSLIEWSGANVATVRQIFSDELATHFHAAVTHAILRIDGAPYTDECRYEVGSVLLLCQMEALCWLWATKLAGAENDADAYDFLISNFLRNQKKWLATSQVYAGAREARGAEKHDDLKSVLAKMVLPLIADLESSVADMVGIAQDAGKLPYSTEQISMAVIAGLVFGTMQKADGPVDQDRRDRWAKALHAAVYGRQMEMDE